MPASNTPPTTSLSLVIQGVLSAVIRGAAVANEASASLVDAYMKDEIHRLLGVPTVEIGEATITLRFAAVAPQVDERHRGPKQASDLEVIIDPAGLGHVDPSRMQELVIRLPGRARTVVDVPDPKEPKKRTPTLG